MTDTSRESYETIWNNVILPEIKRYKDAVISVSYKDTAKNDIWHSYQRLKSHCKNTYMADSEKRLDRHKVAACYMMAILEANPLSFKMEPEDGILITINEHLAITVGLSILNAFICANKQKNADDTVAGPLKDENFNDTKDLILPTTPHGNYRDIFAVELYFTRTERNYNILSLSNTLFLLDEYNKNKI